MYCLINGRGVFNPQMKESIMANDPNTAPDKGKGTEDTGTSQTEKTWETLGFSSEEAMAEAAKEATGLREKVATAEAAVEKEKSGRQKTDSAFMRQTTELGELRKQLKDAEAKAKLPPEEEKTDEELIESLSEDDGKRFDELLDKPENLELKKAVATGGAKAMAEFIRSFNKNAPLDFKAPVFASLKKKKSDYVAKNSIANMVKSLFEQEETTLKNKLPATSPAGSPSDRDTKTKKVSAIGTVSASFYDGTKPKG